MRASALITGWCFALSALASGEGVWIDVGNGCKSNFERSPEPGEVYRWIGPCEDGLATGVGYATIEHRGERFIWRQTNRGGYLESGGPGYARYDLAFWHMPSGKNDWQKIWSGDMPAWARTYLLENKLPARLRQPKDAATAAAQSSEAKLKAAIEKNRITEQAASAEPQWLAVGASQIDVATLSVTAGQPDVYSVFERYNGKYSRLYVTCGPFAWGTRPQGLVPIDHGVTYQVDLAREVCRRSLLAAGNPIVPAYVQPPYRTLMSQGRHAEAFAVAKKAAESGNPAWVRTLAWHYWNGSGVAQDDAEGARLYRRAADAGDAIAMNQIGYAMQNGKGTARDQARAIPWLKRAAELGNPVALINLAWAYQYGNGVAQDLPLALEYANRAKSLNHKDADSFISGIQAMMHRQAQDEGESRRRLAEIEREERREERRREREEREERDRQWMETAQTILQGAAAMKRQNDELEARRRAERARIESDNARYRQMRAEEDRRWLAENQRRQQALEQRAQQERIAEQQRRQVAASVPQPPRRQRVNLPKHTGCISVKWGRNIASNVEQWYHLHNTCAYPLEVHWCDRPGCQRSTAMATIPSGGKNSSWLLKKNGVAVNVLAACQTRNGNEDVSYDYRDNQCWSMVTMN